MNYNIFYSWQSDIDPKSNNYFIKKCIEKAIKNLKADNSFKVIPSLDKDTKQVTGSPEIKNTILRKIDNCQIFIADVTLINDKKGKKKRRTPNPNVLFELGYAVNRLGWDRIILLNNNAFSRISKMPFDIQSNRISQFEFNGNKIDMKDSEQSLISLLQNAIKMIVNDYPNILKREKSLKSDRHDIDVFEGLNRIATDTEFSSFLETIGASYNFSKDISDRLYELEYYLDAERNKFLNDKLNDAALNFNKILKKFLSVLGVNFFTDFRDILDENGQTVTETRYIIPKQPEYEMSYEEFERIKRRRETETNKAILETLNAYNKFRQKIKKALFI